MAPWGYALAAVLEPLTAVGFLVLANERALRTERESARRHRALLDNLPVGVFEASQRHREALLARNVTKHWIRRATTDN